MAELRLGVKLALCGPQPLLDLLGVIGAAIHQAGTQRLARGRCDEYRYRVREGFAYLARPLDLDLEHHGGPGV